MTHHTCVFYKLIGFILLLCPITSITFLLQWIVGNSISKVWRLHPKRTLEACRKSTRVLLRTWCLVDLDCDLQVGWGSDIWIQPSGRDNSQVAPDWIARLPFWLANTQYTGTGARWSSPCSEGRSGVPIPEGHREKGGGVTWKSTEWSKKKKEQGGSPCAVKVQKGLLCAAAFTFFSVISLSLPPNLSLPHSAEGSASSKDTLVDSRKSGCCRSDKNLVGVSVWVEPVEEQRWLHHSAHATPPPPLSPKKKTNKRVKNKQPVTQDTHTETHSSGDSSHTLATLHKQNLDAQTQKKTWRGCNSKTRVVF